MNERRYNVTVIDDDAGVRDILRMAGSAWGGWNVHTFPEVTPESLEGDVQIIFLDHALNGPFADNAQQEIEQVRNAHPEALLVYMSGYNREIVMSRLNGQGRMMDHYIEKPIRRLRILIPELTEKYQQLRK